MRRSSLSPLGDGALDPLYLTRDAVVMEEDRASRMLEEENIRLVESRATVEAERDALRIELLRLKNELEDMKEAYVCNLCAHSGG